MAQTIDLDGVRAAALARIDRSERNFKLFLFGAFVVESLFIVSFFLHLGSRISALGALRIDIVLCGLALLLSLMQKAPASLMAKPSMRPASKLLLILIGYIVFTLPFVRWPGSVLGHGWEPFLKSILFYVLTVRTVTTHLGHAYDKLGISGREQLAAELAERS